MKKALRTLVLAALMCAMLATVVFAAGSDSVWLKTSETTDGTAALIVTDTVVTDGVVTLTYDSEKLTYLDVTVNESYVAMHSVNAREPGIVRISWVAPGPYEIGDAAALIQVNFAGKGEAGDLTLSGAVHDGEGNEITIDTRDVSELKDAIEDAKALNGELYTEETWAALEEALAAGEETLADLGALQDEVDEAAKNLRAAIAALKKIPTTSSPTGDNAMLGLAATLAALAAAGFVATTVNRRRYAK